MAGLKSVRTDDASCNRAQCGVVFVPDCPADAMARAPEVLVGECCPQSPTCQCLPCVVFHPACQPGYLKVQVNKGLGLPGNCCDIFECQPKGDGQTDGRTDGRTDGQTFTERQTLMGAYTEIWGWEGSGNLEILTTSKTFGIFFFLGTNCKSRGVLLL